jgi:hypothetical protein
MSGAGYSRHEIAFLLSLSHEEAIEQTHPVVSSLRKLSDESEGHGFCAGDRDVPLIARWAEVDRAKRRVAQNKESIALTQLRLQGYTDEEVAGMLGLGRRTVGRRWRATLQEILELLGGETDGVELALDHIDRCLRCGENPRARTTRRTRLWLNKRWRWKTIEVPSSMCRECLSGAQEPSVLSIRDACAA